MGGGPKVRIIQGRGMGISVCALFGMGGMLSSDKLGMIILL